MAENESKLPEEDRPALGIDALRNRERNGGRRGDRSGPTLGAGGRARGDHPPSSSGSSAARRRGDHAHPSSGGAGGGEPEDLSNPSNASNTEENPEASLYKDGASTAAQGKVRRAFKKYRKRAAIVGSTAGLGVFGTIMFASITQGPLQFVHYAQVLQKIHMTPNEDFSDSRVTNILIHALAGKGGEQGRLGIKANKAADLWQAYLEKEMGIRPVYTSITRKHVGWEVVDKDKFFTRLLDASTADTKNTAAIERVAGKGAEIRTVGEITQGKQGLTPGRGASNLANDTLILDVRNIPNKEKRVLTRAIGREAHTSKVISAIGSRLLIKRGGVTFHPLENRLPRPGEKLADWYSRLRSKAAKEDSDGVRVTSLAKNDAKDANGNPENTPEIEGATQATNDAVEEAKTSPGRETLQRIVSRLNNGTAVIGVLCGAKSTGKDVEKYKYANNVLPMMRMGMRIVTMGNQVMSGDDLNMKELGAFSETLYDPKTKTSWTNAKSIQAELGQKQTGPDLTPEARLTNIGDKPVFFDALDKTPGLNTACGVSNAVGNLPIIKQASEASSSAIISGLNVVANRFGTSVEGIMLSALAVMSGQSVNTQAAGAERGNLDNTGVFMAANDNAIASGGVPLASSDVAMLKSEANSNAKYDNSTKSFAQRYLDPYDRTTLVASAIDHLPSSKAQLASMVSSPLTSFFSNLSTVFSNAVPSVNAMTSTTSSYDYGVPKFGFSPSERDNPKFEDPFENAAIIEQPGVLEELNEKYGKPCFGMTVTADDNGTSIETESMGSDNLNVFKVMKKAECQPTRTIAQSTPTPSLLSWLFPRASAATQTTGNSDPLFLRFRFYLADALNTNSLACWYGDGASCAAVGFASSGAAEEDSGATEIAGETVDMATIFKSSENVACASGTKDIGVQDGYHDGKKVRIRTCAVSNFPSTSSESSNGLLVVNSRVSGVIYAMSEAAKADGVDFSAASGFRSMRLQECLAGGGCGAAGPAAAPGYSNHQMGLAIDFNNIPSTAAPGSGPTWDWLAKNASKFGYKNLPSEAWHWSPTGD